MDEAKLPTLDDMIKQPDKKEEDKKEEEEEKNDENNGGGNNGEENKEDENNGEENKEDENKNEENKGEENKEDENNGEENKEDENKNEDDENKEDEKNNEASPKNNEEEKKEGEDPQKKVNPPIEKRLPVLEDEIISTDKKVDEIEELLDKVRNLKNLYEENFSAEEFNEAEKNANTGLNLLLTFQPETRKPNEEESLEISNKIKELKLLLVDALIKQDKFLEAEQAAENVIESLDPECEKAYSQLIQCYQKTNKREKAQEFADKLLAISQRKNKDLSNPPYKYSASDALFENEEEENTSHSFWMWSLLATVIIGGAIIYLRHKKK